MKEAFEGLIGALDSIMVEDGGFTRAIGIARELRERKGQVFFIGNGGSAAIASHMACDWGKNGRFAATCFNDGAALTCLANDIGYELAFSDQISRHCREGDLLFAVSSSGQSLSIVHGVWAAQMNKATVITLSGFGNDNRLRGLGYINFYVPSYRYGVVEITHLAILHAILDRITDDVDRKIAA